MLGGLIMCHGDEAGLVLPPTVAPIQVVVLVIKDADGAVSRAASTLVGELERRGLRVHLDDDVDQSFGWRATEWDLQGVPIRVEIGPREVAADNAVLYRRDTREKSTLALHAVAEEAQRLTGRVQNDMLGAATQRRDSVISDCATLAQVRDAAQTGVARVPWGAIGASGEQELAAAGMTVRCLKSGGGALPDDDESSIAYIARAY